MAKKSAKSPSGSAPRRDEPIRIDSDLLDDIRAVTGFNKLSISRYVSDLLRPLVRRDLERYARKVLEKKQEPTGDAD